MGNLIIYLGCFPALSQKHPLNLVLLFLFTLAESYIVAFICGLYEPKIVVAAAVVTAAATIGLTLYAVYTKSDFTTWWSCLNGIAWGAFLMIILLSVMNIWFIHNPFVSNLIAVVFGLIYMAYLVIDTQLIVGKGKHQITLDNYVLGAIFIYIDIIGLFL